MPATYLTSADAGATLAAGVNGNLCTIWDWILNTKGGLTILYTGTNDRIYQMSNGDLLFLRHDSAVSGDARLAVVRLVESASAVTTFTDPSPTVAQVVDANCNIIMSQTASAATRNWWALLDTTLHCFYFFVACSQASGAATWIDGGYVWAGATSELPSDSYCSLTYDRNAVSAAPSTAAIFAAGFNPLNGCTNTWHFKRTRDGTIKSTLATIGPYQGLASAGITAGPIYPDPDDSKMRLIRLFASDGYSASTTSGNSPELCRMFLPRMFEGAHANGGYSGIVLGDTFTASAYDATTDAFAFFPMSSAAGSAGAIVLQKGGTWARPGL